MSYVNRYGHKISMFEVAGTFYVACDGIVFISKNYLGDANREYNRAWNRSGTQKEI